MTKATRDYLQTVREMGGWPYRKNPPWPWTREEKDDDS